MGAGSEFETRIQWNVVSREPPWGAGEFRQYFEKIVSSAGETAASKRSFRSIGCASIACTFGECNFPWIGPLN